MDPSLFVAGFIGALAPEIVRLYTLKQSQVTFQPWYFVISAVYALLGGYLANIAPGVTAAWWAFCVGAGLPTVVNAALRGAGLLMGRAVPLHRVEPVGGEPMAAGGEVTRAEPAAEGGEAAPGGGFWDYVEAL